ncbi:MAG TPA: N-acetylneuraminate synthase family protein [Dehalococcoidales bacterium]|nr:MAG: hypothetical protein A2Z05_07415 [Chloroflexi bacterium RBG_16_60_22]HJX13214.1 N-acetylneuraminate synthase family protein [Dehalococcoidales bacterium]
MKIGDWDLDKEILIVAEIGNNHEGSYALAEKMIKLAAGAGAGAVKFQTFKTEHYVSRRDKARFERLKSFELTEAEFRRLNVAARDAGLLFLSTPFDIGSARFLDSLVPAFKVSSGDNNFWPLLEVVALTGKPIILSAGLMDMEQITVARDFIRNIWRDGNIKQEMAVLHCVASYPVAPAEANLLAINQLKELGVTVGYSDHTLGIEAAVLSAALGARIIEKHFTLDKNYSEFRDHQLSADPEEMARLVERVREVTLLLGTGEKVPQPGEKAVASQVRRAIVAGRDLPGKTVISREDITWVRPASGLPPGEEDRIIGKPLKRAVRMGEPILPEMLGEEGEP